MSDNNFTLDELHQLLDWALSHQQCCGKCDDPALMAKLKEMIKNYCDHDFENTYSEHEIWECTKCGVES
jgi:hypothetical protein